MAEAKSTASYVTNLVIIGIAIILVFVAMQNITYPRHDPFVGRVPMVPIGGGMQMPYWVPGGMPTGQPEMYPQQFYPAKAPYIQDTLEHVGRPCN